MFERFTEKARRVVVLAQEAAREHNHGYIGTEHLLLGLLHEGAGVGCRALESLEVSLDETVLAVEALIERGTSAPGEPNPFTPRAKKVLVLSLNEAVKLRHNDIGTEHILLGLIREGEGVAAQALAQTGADLGKVRHAVVLLRADGGDDESPVPTKD